MPKRRLRLRLHRERRGGTSGVTCPPNVPCQVNCHGYLSCGNIDCSQKPRAATIDCNARRIERVHRNDRVRRIELQGEVRLSIVSARHHVRTAQACDVECQSGSCAGDIACSGASCNVSCAGAACSGNVTCTATTNCTTVCSGTQSCAGNVTSTAQTSSLCCNGYASCGGQVACGQTECTLACAQLACGTPSCTAKTCVLDASTCP